MAHPRRRPATARSVLAGEAAAEAAQKSALPTGAEELPGTPEDTGEPAFPVAGDTRAAAFFDLDNTVMQGAAIFHFGRGLYKRKFFQRRELTRFAWQQAWFRLKSASRTRSTCRTPATAPCPSSRATASPS